MPLFSTKKSPYPPKKTLGTQGEDYAAQYLINKGFKIIERNFRVRGGEIDLIGLKERELHFIEVKTRKSKKFGGPYEAVDWNKQKRMSRAAQYYLLKYSQWQKYPSLFSVLSILISTDPIEIEFFPNAFEIIGGY